MALNSCNLQASFPHFDPIYKEGDNAVLTWAVSVRRDYKKADEQYYPEDLIPIKAFGKKATFIYENFEKGSSAIVTGRLQKGDDYEKDGQTIKGQLFLLVDSIYFGEKKSSTKTSTTSTRTAPATPTPPRSTPGIPNRPASIPGMSKKPPFIPGK